LTDAPAGTAEIHRGDARLLKSIAARFAREVRVDYGHCVFAFPHLRLTM